VRVPTQGWPCVRMKAVSAGDCLGSTAITEERKMATQATKTYAAPGDGESMVELKSAYETFIGASGCHRPPLGFFGFF
jgi:hypothetical protein